MTVERPRGSNQDLSPVLSYGQEVRERVIQNDTLVVVGETGSGKTTQLPQMMMDILPPESKIVVTQPRRLAATSVARYVANQRGVKLGGEVGYQVRFDDKSSEGTKINFLTEGILLRRLQSDPTLSGIDAVMVDEAHERNLNTDILLGLLKNIQERRRQQGGKLNLIVASATLDHEKFSSFFNNTSVLQIPGRQYPVEIHYEHPEGSYWNAAAKRVHEIIQGNNSGNIVVFMPGVAEIDRTIQALAKGDMGNTEVMPLHGQISPEGQDRIFKPSQGRKVVVATNIAETSITIPDTRFVIDSGLVRESRFNPHTGIQGLLTSDQAQSGAQQRAGRAGRTAPGECYRLFSQEDFESRPKFQEPEIKRVDLASVVLQMKRMGIDSIEDFDFIDSPPADSLAQAIDTLTGLGALDVEGKLTSIGEQMSDLPLEPHAARAVIAAKKYNCVPEVCTIAAFSGLRNPLVIPRGNEVEAAEHHRQFLVRGSDFMTLLNVWRNFRQNRRSQQWCYDNFLNHGVLREVENTRKQLLRVLSFSEGDRKPPANEEIAKAITAGHADNLLIKVSKGKYQMARKKGVSVSLHESSVLRQAPPFLAVAQSIVRTDNSTFASIAQGVRSEWLPEVAPQLVSIVSSSARYDARAGRVNEIGAMNYGDRKLSGTFYLDTESRGEDAGRLFAHELAQFHISLPSEVAEHNQTVVEQIWEYYFRSGRNLPNDLNPADLLRPARLFRFFKPRIGDISSVQELIDAIDAGVVDLKFSLDDFIPREVREEIDSRYPIKMTREEIVNEMKKEGKKKKTKKVRPQ